MSKLIKASLLFVLTPYLASCAGTSVSPVNLTQKTLISYPEIGAIVSSALGETLVARGIKETGPAFRLDRGMLLIRDVGCSLKSTYVQERFISGVTKSGDQCAHGFSIVQSDKDGNSGMCDSLSDMTICYSNADQNYYRSNFKPLTFPHDAFSRIEKQTYSSINFVQEFLFNGRVGNNLRFIYRELDGDMMRPAFTQEVQYDLNDSRIVGFKSMKLEILEANNQEIKYKLISNFE